jgi:hypothetical protein
MEITMEAQHFAVGAHHFSNSCIVSRVYKTNTMENNKRQKMVSSSSGSSSDSNTSAEEDKCVLIDIKSLKQSWSPLRALPIAQRESKFFSYVDGPIRGGCFVLNERGDAATLSFCFEDESKHFGLTAVHLTSVGESIFVF